MSYSKRDIKLNRPVAIKFLPEAQSANAEWRARLVREARAASALNHPNIVIVHEIGSENGRDFLVMEFVDGKTLGALIPQGGMKTREAVRVAAQIAAGLGRAHRAGILHRDLKPSNVMVSSEGLVKILDFGLAKQSDNEVLGPDAATKTNLPMSEEGTVAGTVAYMSPEQAEGKKLDPRSDVFAFGSVLYEMLSGRQAFGSSSRISTMASILNQDPAPLPRLPSELERLLRRCLRKEPERRWQSMDDLKIALEDLSDDSAPSVAVPPIAPPGRNPWRIGVAVIAVAAVAALGYWLGRPARTSEPIGLNPKIRRLTEDGGVSRQPAISPDGKLVAYASDRADEGNYDIWVMQTAGGEPVRVTKDPADDIDPAFSPDSSRIAFRSRRDGGGVYVVSALGGEAKLIAPKGHRPGFSPDGAWILYATAEVAGNLSHVPLYRVPSAGGAPEEIRMSIIGTRYPRWSPDSKRLITDGHDPKKRKDDWWLVELDGSQEALALNVSTVISAGSHVPKAWIGEFIYYEASSDLWRIRVKRNKLAGPPERITASAGRLAGLSIAQARGGTALAAFAAEDQRTNIWFAPADVSRGKPLGPAKAISDSLSGESAPRLSGDRKKLVFTRRGKAIVYDLASGQEIEGPNTGYVPGLNWDGRRVTYDASGGAFMATLPALSPTGLGKRRAAVFGFTRGDAHALTQATTTPDDSEARRFRAVELANGHETVVTEHPRWVLGGPDLSADSQWIAFHVIPEPTRRQVFVAPLRIESAVKVEEWIPLSDGNQMDRSPRFSPDGRVIYFQSERDGFRCIWAVPFDPVTRKAGRHFPVLHFHSPRQTLGFTGDTTLIGPAIAPDGILFTLQELRANVWLAEIP